MNVSPPPPFDKDPYEPKFDAEKGQFLKKTVIFLIRVCFAEIGNQSEDFRYIS